LFVDLCWKIVPDAALPVLVAGEEGVVHGEGQLQVLEEEKKLFKFLKFQISSTFSI
jgi:hypothetical protein